MTGVILAAAHQRAADPVDHWVEIGVLIGLIVGLIGATWLVVLAIVVDLMLLGWVTKAAHLGKASIGGLSLPWLLFVALALLLGLYWGRLRGLRHLGEHEFRTRRDYIRGVSRF